MLQPRLLALLLVTFAPACDATGASPRPEAVAPAAALSRPVGTPTPAAASPAVLRETPEAAARAPTADGAAAPSLPATVEEIAVPGHLPASIVRSADGKPPRIVFVAGLCSNAGAYLHGFPEAARANGGAVAVDGEKPCGATPGFRSITSDPAREEPRIDAVLRVAGVASPESEDIIYVGYSLGATLIENLVRKSPERYRRVVLIGSPRDPRLDRLKGAKAVATMSCSLDVPGRMKGAVRTLENAGVAAKYFEMPGCTHGYLTDGERVMGEALRWLAGAPARRR